MTTKIPREFAITAAMRLPAESWALLIELLIGDIPVEPDPEIEAAWIAEVERRVREADPSKRIPGDVVFARVRAATRKPRPERPPVEVDGVVLPVRDVIEACEALPVADRLELAARYLEREQATGQSRHPRTWLKDSARWLKAARAAERRRARKGDGVGMFDVYQPVPGLACSLCATRLRNWQGKEGPRLCLVFRQGVFNAIGTALDGWPLYRKLYGDPVRLPPVFHIYSHDCRRHGRIRARCRSEEGTWSRTEIIPPDDVPA